MASVILETGCFQSECGQECLPSGSGALLILEKTMRKKGRMPIAFICVLQNAPRPAEDLWRKWFRERALACCERGSASRCVDAVLTDFVECFKEQFAGEPGNCGLVSLAALFIMETECFYAWRGEADIRLINDCFGRIHMRRLAPWSATLGCRRARLEPGVRVLLGSAAFFDCLPEPLLKDCLAVRGAGGENRAARCLEEAAREAQRRGAGGFAAAVVAAEPEQHAEFGELLERSGYGDAKPVGSGAFGRVYRVRKRQGKQYFACKLAEGPKARALLRREAGLQSALTHPLFVRYAGLEDGKDVTALFMEYVRGRDLDEILRRGELSWNRAVEIARQLAEGLSYLHERDDPVIYRDLKPCNIRVGPKGKVKLLDLGCACGVSEAGYTMAGSRGYAAPEQLGSQNGEGSGPVYRTRCGPGSDIYAWGRVLEEMLGGRQKVSSLMPLIEECTREDPRQRPQRMRDVLRELEKF